MKNQSAKLTSTTIVPEVNVVNNHMYGRTGWGRKNGRDRLHAEDNILGSKNTHQKRGRNNDQAKIWNIYSKNVKENAIGIIPYVP